MVALVAGRGAHDLWRQPMKEVIGSSDWGIGLAHDGSVDCINNETSVFGAAATAFVLQDYIMKGCIECPRRWVWLSKGS